MNLNKYEYAVIIDSLNSTIDRLEKANIISAEYVEVKKKLEKKFKKK